MTNVFSSAVFNSSHIGVPPSALLDLNRRLLSAQAEPVQTRETIVFRHSC